jgi:DNA-binding NtrC family response regulator
MEKKKILVVDDDTISRESVVEVLRRKGYGVEACACGRDALEAFSHGVFDCVISDIRMPGMSGIELLGKLKQIDPDVPVLVITAFGEVELAVEAMKKGAEDFIQKSEKLLDQLELSIDRTLHYRTLLTENRRLKNALSQQWSYIGATPAMQQIRDLVRKVAESRSTVLIAGESGTGKELIARSIHFQSPRQNGPFVKINCAAMPEGLIESELFGHEKGAFTGALRTKAGKFELASGGTLLLDEIGEMPVAMQAKLLRVLQEQEINKVGGDAPVEIDVRIVATTNRRIEEEITKGLFREDLFYRLNVFNIHLPPLRERPDDIEALAEHFVGKFNAENGFGVEGFEPGCFEVIKRHTWPGNIRELEHAVERAVVLTRTGRIKPELFDVKRPRESVKGGQQPGMTIAEAERNLILSTLEFCGHNRTKSAQMLDISIRTLRNKLHEYGMTREEPEEE